MAATRFVENAHGVQLVVHPWTFRRENTFLPTDYRQGNPAHPAFAQAAGDLPRWLTAFYRLGVDGVFSDNPDSAVAVRAKLFSDGG